MKTTTSTIDYLVPDSITFREAAGLLKKKNLQIHLSYGSGGFCCSLMDLEGKKFVGYSYDVIDAIKKSLIKYDDHRSEMSIHDEPTVPNLRFEDIIKPKE